MHLSGKGIIITGAAVRLGNAISKELAGTGAQLFCHYHSSHRQAHVLEDELRNLGSECHFFQADLTSLSQIKKLVEEAHFKMGRIDALINNAAVFYKTPLGQVSEADWDSFMDLNLKAPFFLAQEVSHFMQQQGGGKIVNIADAGAVRMFPGYLPYSVSKAGLVALTTGLAKALAPDIQVNCINPGPVLMPEEISETERVFALEQTLLKREGHPTDIARTVRFILEGTDYMTGAIIPVDGGRQIR
jgi:NAD(P)-dependent dehydrogenase (short-subunit alcohol dehydrogenase family)